MKDAFEKKNTDVSPPQPPLVPDERITSIDDKQQSLEKEIRSQGDDLK